MIENDNYYYIHKGERETKMLHIYIYIYIYVHVEVKTQKKDIARVRKMINIYISSRSTIRGRPDMCAILIIILFNQKKY